MYEGYIYLIRNNVNGKVYIGQTSQTVEGRWRCHVNAAHSKRYSHLYLYKAIAKYGVDSFSVDVICTVSAQSKSELKQALNTKEKEFIRQYRSNKNEYGYNLTDGGDSISRPTQKAILKVNKLGNVVARYDSQIDAEKDNGLTHSSVAYACKSNNHYSGGFYWFYAEDYPSDIQSVALPVQITTAHPGNDHSSKEVVQLSKHGLFIQKFNSAKEAERQLGVNQAGISKCCLGKRKTAGGYQWSFAIAQN